MKNVFKKRIISLIILSVVIAGGIFAKTSIALNAGSINSIFFYNQNGVLVNNITSSYINVNDTLVLKSTNNKAVFTYKYGKIVLDKESILVIKEKNLNFTFYLVDGTAEISSKATSLDKVSVITPVTSYSFNGVGEIKIISTKQTEAVEVYSGITTVYNSITGKTYNIHANNKMDLNTPKLIAINELDKKDSREAFVNETFPYGVKAIAKSNDNVDQYVLNILATGNGQGNVNLLNFATFKGILDEADIKNEKYLLIDAGNTLSGSVYVNQDKGETASKILEKVGYDVFVPGSYDFAYGYKQLQKLDIESNVTFLSSNALTSDDYSILTPYQLYAFNDLRIAVVGLSNPSELTKLDNLKFSSKIIIDNAQAAIDTARQYVDLVILATNYSDKNINSRVIAKNIKGIDLIIDGSRSIAGISKEGDTYIVSTGVGFNKIIDTQVSVYKNNIISINPLIIHSSNVRIDNKNQLASSLGVYKYTNNEEMSDLLSNVSVKDGLSTYLISPEVNTMSSSLKYDAPKVPTFSKFIVRKAQVNIDSDLVLLDKNTDNSSEIPDIKAVKTVNDIKATSPIFVSNKIDAKYLNDQKEIVKVEEVKNSFGIKATIEANATTENFDFTDYIIPIKASIVPYFKSKNLALALYFDVTMEDVLDENKRDIENSITPFPEAEIRKTYQYAINFIDELSFSSDNNKFNFELKKETFDSPIRTPLVYRKLGSKGLTFRSNFEYDSVNTQVFITDPTFDSYYTTVGTKEHAGIVETISLVDNNLVIQVAGLASGQNGIINMFPVLSTTYTFLNKPNFSLGFNVNATSLIELQPSINFDSILGNYFVGSSLILNSDNNVLEAGLNYLATDDVNAFNTNLLHMEFNRSDLFSSLESNSVVPFLSIDSKFSTTTAHLGYSLPWNLTNNQFENDLADFSIDYESDKFSAGLFFIQSNLIYNIKNFTTLTNFLYSDNVEYGINATWKINDMVCSAMKAGVTSVTDNPLYLNLCFTFDLDKEF
jgi:hypothetical protein